MQIIQRIKKAYNLETDAEVAKFLEIKPSTLSMQKNRGRLNIKRILEKCSDLNRNWLLDGEGPKKKESLNGKARRIPVYSSLEVANNGEPNLQNSDPMGDLLVDITSKLRKFSSLNHMIGYVISDHGMTPTLRSDDIAIVDLEQRKPKDETIFLLSSDHSAVCRRIKENSGNSYTILADNTEKSSFDISKEQNNYEIIGEIIWVMRSV